MIGGGHNGLTAAAYLSRAGKKVLVLARRYSLGGAAVTEASFPGFKFDHFYLFTGHTTTIEILKIWYFDYFRAIFRTFAV